MLWILGTGDGAMSSDLWKPYVQDSLGTAVDDIINPALP